MLLGVYFLAVVVALVLQTHLVFHDVSIVWHVDLALLVMVSGCLQWEERRVLVFGFMTGLMHDAKGIAHVRDHVEGPAQTHGLAAHVREREGRDVLPFDHPLHDELSATLGLGESERLNQVRVRDVADGFHHCA